MMKTIRDYINLIENLQRQGVAEGGSRKAREDAKTKEINRHAGLYAYHTKQGNKAEAAKHKAELDKLHNQVNEQGGAEERWRVTVGNKSGTLSHTKVFTGTKEQAIKQAVRRFATTRDPVVRAELVDQGVAEGLEQVYKVLAVDKSNALSKQVKLKVKASSLDEVFERLAINDWYPLEINGVEVINGKRLKQGVAEEQLEETTPEAIAKIDQITRR
jgi:flavin-binding protein dodecin